MKASASLRTGRLLKKEIPFSQFSQDLPDFSARANLTRLFLYDSEKKVNPQLETFLLQSSPVQFSGSQTQNPSQIAAVRTARKRAATQHALRFNYDNSTEETKRKYLPKNNFRRNANPCNTSWCVASSAIAIPVFW